MKTILLSIATLLTVVNTSAQYSQNFESTEASLISNCWTFTGVHISTTQVISGTSSVYTDPLTGTSPKELITPALNVSSTSFTVSFKYKLTNNIPGAETRSFQVGLLSPSGTFTSLNTTTLTSSSPTTVQNFNQTFTLGSTGWRKLVIRASGSNGVGNARLIFDDLSTNASPLYGSGTCNSAPIAVNDVFSATGGQPLTGDVMFNDSEPNGESMQSAVVTTSPDGNLIMNANGTFIFTPNPGFTGSVATFTYQLTDNGFSPVVSNIGTVTINFSAPVPLPVTLKFFSATLNTANEVDLKWTTSSEKSASYFLIEKSLDGKTYDATGQVAAKGYSSELINYDFTDKDINTTKAGIIYYRLRSVDIDGIFELSTIKTITIGTQNRGINVSTYPNPVNSQLNVTLPSTWQNKKIILDIISNNGHLVKRTVATSGTPMETIDLSNLAPGMYIISATCNGEKAFQKIIKK